MKQISKRVKNLIQNMPLEHKIGQLNQVWFRSEKFPELIEMVKKGLVGSFILASSETAGNTENEKTYLELLNELQKASIEATGIPIINGRDVIHGHEIVFPIPLAFAASFDMKLIKESYRRIAEEAVNDGVHWSFAPMLDISRDPRWGRCIEGAGEDPYLGSCVARAVVEGFQGDDHSKRNSIAACAKHFIGYGAAEGGRDYEHAEIGENTLRNIYLPAFKSAVNAGAATVMSAFSDIGGIPMSSNKHLLTEVLKEELEFDGFVVSDWGSVRFPLRFGVAENEKDCVVQSFDAGIDMDMVSQFYLNNMTALIAEGKISEERLNDAVARILTIKEQFGLFDAPFMTKEDVNYAEHKEYARKAAENSMVLLKNDNMLPLKRTQKIALVGPMAEVKRELLGSWTLDFDLQYVKSIQEAMQEYQAELLIPAGKLEDDMVACMRKADIVVVAIGESHKFTGERMCVAHLEVSESQKKLIKMAKSFGKKVIAVACYGRPAVLTEIEPMCDAILYAWHCGTGTAEAVTNILFGECNPCGHLPMTLPRATGQVPIYYNGIKLGMQSNCYYDNASQCYQDEHSVPLYAFGYGLSYAKFTYSDIEIVPISLEEIMSGAAVQVRVTVTNIGSVDGHDVVQCYIRDKVAEVARPLRELKGFEKVFLKAGESAEVIFTLGTAELGYYNRSNQFVVEKGLFEVYVGGDCTTDNCTVFQLD